ncbi:FAD-dependent oxidoreductase [Gordonia jinghuaiqii]|uniref:Glycerol-3-phosphate dehydrogenase n=1 Tax=Gordonia jinghuaiqii TaxID=2758710 RepID=A0A7D7R021_9ACTN|nr:glycerol-3-phosphate dehydrogenase/oxidase [Gordonia jinghuaiqii]MCR5979047.1 FAD-dependent oxidoreductase [Gordonia jinghuaiqii]QMT01631.1 glycerol-3-phosphate dehydrogenase/oxidase [Gordonia jinghuaiqii]
MATLSPSTRRRSLEYLASRAEPVDLLVVGGGITGVGVALDAATRGLSVALVEKGDLAAGTSRWSSKLVHGGLRYLAKGDIRIARESAVERHHLMTAVAPHLIAPLRQILPDRGGRQAPVIRFGLRAGDMLRRNAGTPASLLPPPSGLSLIETLARCPTLSPTALRGGISTTDGQLIDDARLVVAVARTAAGYGASICTHTRADRVDGRGATLTDTCTGESFDIGARMVVNATGVWSGEVDQAIAVTPSRGTHLVLDAATMGNPTAALTIPLGGSVSRFVFTMPAQLGRVYVGITDVAAPGPIPDVPTPDSSEIDFLLDALNPALVRPIDRTDIIGTFSGLRPLVDRRAGAGDGGPGTSTGLADVSRRHHIRVRGDGLVSVLGGKLTTYRRMAQDAVDAALATAGLAAGDCVTTTTPLVGALRDPREQGLPTSLVQRFGGEAPTVVDTSTVDRPLDLITPGIDVTRAEIEFAVTHEGALDVEDVLHRRTRIGLVDRDAEAARPEVEKILGYVLG